MRLGTRSSRIWLLLALWACSIGPSAAATFVVDNPVDQPDAQPGDGFCAAASVFGCTLRAAIMESNALAGADVIELAANPIVLSIAGTDEDLAETGDLDILDSVIVRSSSNALTTIDASGLDRVFDVLDGGETRFENLIITGGEAIREGGGMRILAGTVRISNSRIRGNQAGAGGAISTRRDVTVENSWIFENHIGPSKIVNVQGSAIFARDGSLTLDSTAVYYNNATGVRGGAIQTGFTPTLIINSTISDNRNVGANTWSAISAFGTATTTVRSSTIADHDVGLNIRGDSALVLRNSIVAYNGMDCDVIALVQDMNGHNLDSDGSCGLDSAFGDLPNTDPLLGPLLGTGNTMAHQPLPGSPLVDMGSPQALSNSDVDACPLLDQQGQSRTTDGDGQASASECDIGAVELINDALFADGFEG